MSYSRRIRKFSSNSGKLTNKIFAKRKRTSPPVEENRPDFASRVDTPKQSEIKRKENDRETTQVNAAPATEAVQAQCDACEPKTEAEENKLPIQSKLTVGKPNDLYEQEADATAAKVVQMINSPVTSESVQNQEDVEGNTKIQPTVMRKGGLGGGEVDGEVEKSIQQARGGGQGIDEQIKGPMEEAFGANFSDVRLHTDGEANQLNKSLNSRAFATGQDIFFKQGEYNPGSRNGQELLAHELTHVVQQNGAAVQAKKKQPEHSIVSLKEIPILNGVRPRSEVLTHLQTLKGKTDHNTKENWKDIVQLAASRRSKKNVTKVSHQQSQSKVQRNGQYERFDPDQLEEIEKLVIRDYQNRIRQADSSIKHDESRIEELYGQDIKEKVIEMGKESKGGAQTTGGG